MKILHVIANLAPRYGGPSKACFEMARAIVALGHQVDIFTTNQDGPEILNVPLNTPVNKDGVNIYYFPIQFPRFFGTSWPLAKALKDKIKTYDLVHIHSLYLFHDAVAAYYCRKYKIPYIIRPHGTLDPYIYRRHRCRKRLMEILFQNSVIKNAAAIHFTTEEEMHLAQPYVFNRPGFVVPNGINFNDYQDLPPKGTFIKQHPVLQNKKLILFLGRINFKKGLDLLIPAFAKALKTIPEAHLILAGPDNDGYMKNVNQWIKDNHVIHHVTYVGMLEGQQKLAALHDADLFVLPSYSENFGITVIETLACKTPVLISDHVNICREITDAGAGVVTACEIEPLANELTQLLKDDDKRKNMGEQGANLVESQFSWPLIGERLLKVYEEIVSR